MSEFEQKSPVVSSRNNEVSNYEAARFILLLVCAVFVAFILIEHVIDPTAWLYLQYFPYAPF